MRERRAGVPAAAVAVVALSFAGGADASTQALREADAPAAQLDRVSTSELAQTDVARYAQEVGGIPVVGASVTVTDAPGGPAEVLFDKSVAGLSAPGTPAVSRSEAVAAALGTIGNPSGGHTSARLVIDATRGNQLAWEVTHFDRRPISDWLVTVGADAGDVIGKEDRLRRATGSASLFVPNAVVANNGYEGIRDRGDRDSGALTSLRQDVQLQDLTDGQTCLKGDWANVRFSAKNKKVCKDSLNWDNVTRESNRFEALMAYYHMTEMQQYIQTLDLDPINEERQFTVANSFSDDNSFYMPGADEIQFGTGGVDDGEDADVIVHEYGHAVQDDQIPNFGGNPAGAMGEGFGDYLAAVHQIRTVGFDPEWAPCIMEWDATSYDDEFTDPPGICLRRADDPDSRPDQIDECGGGFQIHCVGQVWSSSLLDLRQELGDDVGGDSVGDTLVLASHFLLPSNPTFNDAAAAIMEADDAIYGGLHCGDLASEFDAREFGTFTC